VAAFATEESADSGVALPAAGDEASGVLGASAALMGLVCGVEA
jgi:hypothetical protein